MVTENSLAQLSLLLMNVRDESSELSSTQRTSPVLRPQGDTAEPGGQTKTRLPGTSDLATVNCYHNHHAVNEDMEFVGHIHQRECDLT